VISGLSIDIHIRIHCHFSTFFRLLASGPQQIFRMSNHPQETKSPPTDDFLSKVLDPQFVSFLPRRIEDSATVIWVYLYKQCDFVETFFQTESNVRNFATFGLFVSNEQNSLKKKVLLFGFHDINTKPNNASLHNPLERPSDCRVSWTKEQPKQEICRKIGRFQFCSFLTFLGLVSLT